MRVHDRGEASKTVGDGNDDHSTGFPVPVTRRTREPRTRTKDTTMHARSMVKVHEILLRYCVYREWHGVQAADTERLLDLGRFSCSVESVFFPPFRLELYLLLA